MDGLDGEYISHMIVCLSICLSVSLFYLSMPGI